ncbi:MAG: VanZ family protein [archaeon]
MISWLERNKSISWAITLIIAIIIFYVSSLSFKAGEGGSNLNAILYHLVIFFILGFFLLISLLGGKKKYLILCLGILAAVFYALLDEIHQFFVPGRYSSISDVLVDSLGIIYAAMIYFIIIKYRENKNVFPYFKE